MASERTSGVPSSTDDLDLQAASRDLWPLGTLDAWQGRSSPQPDRVWWPSGPDDVARVLEAAQQREVAVVPYGAGSGVCGGARGRAGAWVIDTKRLSHLTKPDERSWSVTVGAGVIGQQLEDWLARHGFTCGHSPSSVSCSTVGGWAAARSAGQFSSRYGVFEDMVLGLEAVSPAHGPFRVGEGFDTPASWMDQLLGSEGTLAVITEVTLRIWPTPAHRWLRGYRFGDIGSALRAMRRITQGELHPAVVRLYDPVDTRIGGRTQPRTEQAASRRWLSRMLGVVDAIPALRARALALPLALPGLVNRVFDRLTSGCLLIVGWEGAEGVVEASAAAGHRILCEEGSDLGEAPGRRWLASRHAVSYKLMPIFERGGFVDTMEVAARWSQVEPLYRAVRAALQRHCVVMAHMSHVYPEGACIYFSFAGAGDRARYLRAWSDALTAVREVGATLSHHHGVGELKASAATSEIGPAVAGWRALKSELDPAEVMNPGRLFTGLREAAAPGRNPPAVADLEPDDGLARSSALARLTPRCEVAEPMWPWRELPAPPRWQRQPWQTPWIEVGSRRAGVLLGRGPRSAVGPDLRDWLAAEQRDATATWAVAPPGPRWMGEAELPYPWEVALALVRGDLRPSGLGVDGQRLLVGFRGPAARDLGQLASLAVPGGLREIPWQVLPLPSGPLEPCSPRDPLCVHVTAQGGFRARVA